jgi:hypothetical protein
VANYHGESAYISWHPAGFPLNVRFLLSLVGFALAGCVSQFASAEELVIPRQQHPWGHFEPGSWKKVSVVTQNFDDKGQVVGTSITESKTTLEKADNDGITLKVESTVDVGGKRLESPQQKICQGYPGQPLGQTIELKSLASETVSVEGKDIRCQVWQLKNDNPDGQRVTKLFYSGSTAPYVLRRETQLFDKTNPKISYDTTVEVVALEMPYKVLDEVHTVAYEKTTAKGSRGILTTVAVVSPDMPGGVVTQTTKEADASGKLLSRSTLEIVDYGVTGDENHPAQVRRRFLLRDRPRLRDR